MRSLIACLIGLLLCGLPTDAVWADEIQVLPSDDLQQVLENATAGDRLLLAPGTYHGNFRITRPIELDGQGIAVIDGGGTGYALRIQAPGVRIRGLEIRHWGSDLSTLDAGVFVEPAATGVEIRDNRLQGDGFGIWLDGAADARVIGNRIEGNTKLRSADRGNGIHLSSVSGSLIKDNEVWHTRDGLYIESSNHNRLVGNYLHDLRYGVHYMYAYNNDVSYNHTRNTRTGYALMQSKYLTVTHNRSENDRNYGILMNYITHSAITDNWVEGVQSGRSSKFADTGGSVAGAEGKALFIYNSLFNEIRGNRLSASDLGIHLTAGSEDNRFVGNAFIGNKEQVKYVANRLQEWSDGGRGNYWSDYLGWDLDGDGIGDQPYQPNDGVDKLLWQYPNAKVLLNSPAVEVLRWVQRQFPVLQPPGVADSHPLMRPPQLTSSTADAGRM
ncbi:nitrous oxide reductase family maturation protein NosD [Marinobacterium sp. D7]|uniref:nitrous oxide reductase family maturation protein NosD n=1 Tax=Marinobacterium ramblicola TaxID=2849041 RepID=UPI001C2D9CD2|nr:nitrous oxide reductase family maturation protein NosD [Marinobacterium ramblicola]MBV1790323.1 nitrous oxide reductase family maturation protein NosD [Marinobacterium ramblicola]